MHVTSEPTYAAAVNQKMERLLPSEDEMESEWWRPKLQ